MDIPTLSVDSHLALHTVLQLIECGLLLLVLRRIRIHDERQTGS